MRLTTSRSYRAAILTVSICAGGCAGSIVRVSVSPAKPNTDALLVLPGLGYGRDAERTLRSLAPAMAAEGVDLFVPTYLARAGLAESRENLQRFIRDRRLDRYERVHVFAFLAGGWTLNPLVERDRLPNLATVVYDRSPLQERAPRIAAENLRFFAWLRYGSLVFDLAKTPYPPIASSRVKVALVVETVPTPFVRKHERAARGYGSFQFECDALGQRYDDCVYVAINHTDLYVRFAEVWPQVRAFIETGRFGGDADRTPPAGDPLACPEQRRRARRASR